MFPPLTSCTLPKNTAYNEHSHYSCQQLGAAQSWPTFSLHIPNPVMKHTDHSLIYEKTHTNYYTRQGCIYGTTFALASFHSFDQTHASAVSLAQTHTQTENRTNTCVWLTILISRVIPVND